VLQFIEDHNVECDLRTNGSLYVVRFEEEMQDLRREYERLKQANLIDLVGISLLDAEDVQQMTHTKRFVGGMMTRSACSLHPPKLVHAIAEQAVILGAHLNTNTKVTQVESINDNLLRITTTRGICHASQVVYANNAWVGELLPFARELITPTRGQVIATKPLPNYWNFGLLFNDGWEYMIQREDGRVILGGCRWKSPTTEQPMLDDSNIQENVSEGLHSYLKENFEELFDDDLEIEEEWTGIMAFSKDDMPIVGRVPNTTNQFISAGYTGQGMPTAFLSAKGIADMILGKQAYLPEIYDPKRFTE
jgi:glycine/D-amino acid oxidase-like deaminating enzyme